MHELPRQHFLPGSTIFSYGDLGDCAYVIESGAVEVLDKNGNKIATMLSGDFFGEVALLDQQHRTATIRAVVRTVLLRIERKHIQELLKRTDPVVRYLLTLLLMRFRSRISTEFPASGKTLEEAEAPDESVATRTLMLAQDAVYAIENNQLDLAYQPMISLSSNGVVGFEALVRWCHPLLGTVMPSNLINLAERTGLIHSIGHWVLHQALSDWKQLREHCHRHGHDQIFLSINLSAVELTQPQIADNIIKAIEDAAVPANEIQIELTETLIIEDFERITQTIATLNAHGVTIALDDYGSGHAGLDTLNRLPISCLKIDRSFVQSGYLTSRSEDIVRNSIQLAKSLGMKTIAEGVETVIAKRKLCELGCDIAQGYFFAHPMPLAEALIWIADPLSETE